MPKKCFWDISSEKFHLESDGYTAGANDVEIPIQSFFEKLPYDLPVIENGQYVRMAGGAEFLEAESRREWAAKVRDFAKKASIGDPPSGIVLTPEQRKNLTVEVSQIETWYNLHRELPAMSRLGEDFPQIAHFATMLIANGHIPPPNFS